ncbi:MAG: methylmalonyl-CoA mutase family protein [Planctomycetes bacterium]|nr:methylmalonyl-CoA mutase family protein [Planctomycetota bacterium]
MAPNTLLSQRPVSSAAPESPTPADSSSDPAGAGFHASHKIRLVTATSLFDGHDASIHIFRRIAQASGAEVIHLGHNRSVREIVEAAIQEDAQGIAVTSYQGGHNEFFRYMHDVLAERGCGHVRLFGGGGGVILPEEIAALQAYGIERIYSPDDGRAMGLQGMIDDMLQRSDFATVEDGEPLPSLPTTSSRDVARAITLVESTPTRFRDELRRRGDELAAPPPVLGITGTGGAGKSSLIDELLRRFLLDFPRMRIAVLCVDPTRRKTGGALLGDRIRMNSASDERVFVRSMATRRAHAALSESVNDALTVLKLSGFDLILLESSGIGQSDTEIIEHADLSLYVMTPEFGAQSQLEKIDMLDFADVVAINKFDRRGARDALRDVKKQVQRNHKAFDRDAETMPVYGTMAATFADPGTNTLYHALARRLDELRPGAFASTMQLADGEPATTHVIPGERVRYLAEIVEHNRRYSAWAREQAALAERVHVLELALQELPTDADGAGAARGALQQHLDALQQKLAPECREALDGWDACVGELAAEHSTFQVRGRAVKVDNHTTSLSGLRVPKVAMPRYRSHGDRLRWLLEENLPGHFPYTAGVYPFKRTAEDPTRMFAGEGGPERTNRRFHYLSYGQPFKRLSTAFDSVTLYGEDPAERPDIFGKVGNAGVSICTLDDAKRLYSGFDLCAPVTSVSMTINGPAPMLLAFFLNAAIDQQCERWLAEQGKVDEANAKIDAHYATKNLPRPRYRGQLPQGHDGLGTLLLGVSGDQVVPPEVYAEIREKTLQVVRGTVQADILKEDQAQNTCIFSTEFALRMMGDVQQFFTENGVRNFYSVSISGYHIAEAGANPITQLAFTLSNGFTYVEYYLSRGLKIDDFAPNLSFFFSNGTDPEYAVIGRVARRIWAKAIKHRYGGNERSQMLKYHIQTSGRSLHAQEIDFNDIRTTLQALYAIYDNCNSLHTNAYDEAITTPTEQSVRRAVAIQLIINRELGLAKNENPLQGSFIIEELTDLVEEAVYAEFLRISERGGVLGAMETMYQRSKIQDESMLYEGKKASGELPIVGVNTFLGKDGSPIQVVHEVMRSTDDEKHAQIADLANFHAAESQAEAALKSLQQAALNGGNVFASLMEAAKTCSLGQMSSALYEVGGQYRRNM